MNTSRNEKGQQPLLETILIILLPFAECSQHLPSQRSPYLHGLICAPRGDALAIRGPGHRPHGAGMPAIDEDMPAIGCIPHLRGCIASSIIDIPASRNDLFAIWLPGPPPYSIIIPALGEDTHTID